jgi:hypothetical protein
MPRIDVAAKTKLLTKAGKFCAKTPKTMTEIAEHLGVTKSWATDNVKPVLKVAGTFKGTGPGRPFFKYLKA